MYRLKFTGDCDEATFKAVCAKHDFWYHSYYFDNGFKLRGDYNIGENVKEYGFPDDMIGVNYHHQRWWLVAVAPRRCDLVGAI